MEKKKSRRLQVVQRLAAMDEQKKMLALSKSRLALEQQQQLMQQLQDYSADYQTINQHSELATSSAELQRLQNASRFMLDLDSAIVAQAQREQQSESDWQAKYSNWTQGKARCDALQGIVEKHQQVEARELENAEDRESTEQWIQTRKPA